MNPRLKRQLDNIRLRAAQALDASINQPKQPDPLREDIHIRGTVRVREVPFKDEAEWRRWWLGEFDDKGRMIRPPRMSEREKERYTVTESENMLVANGITQVLNYVGTSDGSSVGFAQQLAFGNTPLSRVNESDTSLAGEFLRIAPSPTSILATQTEVSAFHPGGSSSTVFTNAGLFGNGATGTLGSGTLMTHLLLQYTQPAASTQIPSVSFDYLISYI